MARKPNPFLVRHGAIIVTMVAFACLAVWWLSPIYPDEIAFRQQLGRSIADRGLVYGLYGLCESNVKTIPVVFQPAAWLLSATFQALSPLDMRILSFASVLGVIFAAARLIAKERHPIASFALLASFAGVAGSGLIYVRYEFALELHLLSCLAAACVLRSSITSALMDGGIALVLIACASISVWCHIQGLTLLPLTAYLLTIMAVRRFGRVGLGAVAVPFLLLLYPAVMFHRSICTEYPAIETFWRKMVFDPSVLLAGPFDWLVGKLSLHIGNFLFAAQFPVRYLPGVESQDDWVSMINLGVASVVGLAGLTLVVLLAAIPIFWRFAAKPQAPHAGSPSADRFILSLSFLIAAPAGFLFLYDSAHNFYRSFYIHHIAVVAIAMAISAAPMRRAAVVASVIGAVSAAIAAVSILASAVLLVPPLWQGYEGPSLSIFRDWSATRKEVKALAGSCGADLNRGRIVTDDLTQDVVLTKPQTFPVTYVSLQASIAGLPIAEALQRIRPNYAILQCRNFGILNLTPRTRRGDLCCFDFGTDGK